MYSPGMKTAATIMCVAALLLASCGNDDTATPAEDVQRQAGADTLISVDGCRIEPGTACPSADLAGVNLSGANLGYAFLAGSDFTGSNLTGVNLSGASLESVDFTRANLTGTNFTGADITYAEFTGATFSNTIMPDGSVRNS